MEKILKDISFDEAFDILTTEAQTTGLPLSHFARPAGMGWVTLQSGAEITQISVDIWRLRFDAPKPVIVRAEIVGQGHSWLRGGFLHMVVMVEYSDGTIEDLTSYYPDEHGYRAYEFIGLTEEAAIRMVMGRDVAYLQS